MAMTQEEIDDFVNGLYGKKEEEKTPEQQVAGAVLAPALAAAKNRKAAPPEVDNTQGMSGPQLFAAGLGKQMLQLPRGMYELGIGAFGSDKDIQKYNAEKAERDRIDNALMQNWQAKVGAATGQVGGAALLPARLPAQIAGAVAGSALSPTQGNIGGMELPTRALNGLEGGASTAVTGAALPVIGKGLGALTGQYTNPGMVAAGRAARRQGIVPNTGALGSGPMSRGVEEGSAWYPELVQRQAEQFARQASQEVPVAGATLGTTTTKNIPGEGLRQSIVEAGEKVKRTGSKLWQDLDSYITNNNLPPPIARDTQRTFNDIATRYSTGGGRTPNLTGNEIFQYIQNADTASGDAASLLRGMLNSRRVAIPSFSDLHETQSVVGKALARARYDADARNAPASAKQAVRELGNLYRSIESDIASWATTNPTANQMFRQSKDYWRDTVVPGVINNDVYQKASRGSLGSSNRGYDEPRQFFADLLNKPEEAKALYPTMDQKGRDLITSLHLLPDMSTTMTSPRLQSVMASGPGGALLETGMRAPPSMSSGMGTTARAAAGTKPGLVQLLLGHAPGSKFLGTNQAAQEFGLGRNVFRDTNAGRGAYGALQFLQTQAEQRLHGTFRPDEEE